MSHLTIVSFVIAVMLFPLVAVGGLLVFMKYVDGRRKRRSPLTSELLRPPGYSLSERLWDLDLELTTHLIGAIVTPLAAMTLYFALRSLGDPASAPNPVVMIIAGFIMLAVFAGLARRTVVTIRRHRDGLDGERATAQLLEPIIVGGGRVLHDIQAPGFNIDHVVVAPGGVFAIETKHRLKPTRGRGTDNARVRFDGKALHFPDWIDTATATQAAAQARWLSDRLSRATGAPVKVRPVIALPGWWVEVTERSEVMAINPKACQFMLKTRADVPPLTPKAIQSIAFQVEQLCTLPDRNAPRAKSKPP